MPSDAVHPLFVTVHAIVSYYFLLFNTASYCFHLTARAALVPTVSSCSQIVFTTVYIPSQRSAHQLLGVFG